MTSLKKVSILNYGGLVGKEKEKLVGELTLKKGCV